MKYKPEDIVFYDTRTGNIHDKGAVGVCYSGWWYNGEGEPPSFDMMLELHEVLPVINYLNKQFPKGWKIENEEVVEL